MIPKKTQVLEPSMFSSAALVSAENYKFNWVFDIIVETKDSMKAGVISLLLTTGLLLPNE